MGRYSSGQRGQTVNLLAFGLRGFCAKGALASGEESPLFICITFMF